MMSVKIPFVDFSNFPIVNENIHLVTITDFSYCPLSKHGVSLYNMLSISIGLVPQYYNRKNYILK